MASLSTTTSSDQLADVKSGEEYYWLMRDTLWNPSEYTNKVVLITKGNNVEWFDSEYDEPYMSECMKFMDRLKELKKQGAGYYLNRIRSEWIPKPNSGPLLFPSMLIK